MNIALFGATGTIGQRILDEALRRGHEVTAIARDPSKLNVESPNVTAVKADVLDAASVAKVVAGHDAVVSSFAPVGGQTPDALAKAARSLIAGLKRAGVRRLVVVGGAGSLKTATGEQLVETSFYPDAWKPLILAHRDSLDVYRAEGAGLDWTYFSPAAVIEPGPRTGEFRLGDDQLITDSTGQSRISTEDYAIALLDELETPRHVGRRFTVAY